LEWLELARTAGQGREGGGGTEEGKHGTTEEGKVGGAEGWKEAW
jgi:hypothetical protein